MPILGRSLRENDRRGSVALDAAKLNHGGTDSISASSDPTENQADSMAGPLMFAFQRPVGISGRVPEIPSPHPKAASSIPKTYSP